MTPRSSLEGLAALTSHLGGTANLADRFRRTLTDPDARQDRGLAAERLAVLLQAPSAEIASILNKPVSDGDPIGEDWLNLLLIRLLCLEAEVVFLRELLNRQPVSPQPTNGFKVHTTANS